MKRWLFFILIIAGMIMVCEATPTKSNPPLSSYYSYKCSLQSFLEQQKMLETRLNQLNQMNFGFGKNFIMHSKGPLSRKFNWKIYRTAHIDVYFYPEEEEMLPKFVDWVQNAYDYISASLNYKIPIEERPSLFFFANIDDFSENVVIPGVSGALGVAEPIRFRIIIPRHFDDEMSLRLVTHEMTHIFEFSMWYGGKIRLSWSNFFRDNLIWIFEGLAQQLSGLHKDGLESNIHLVRYLSLKDNIPPIEIWGNYEGYIIDYALAPQLFDFIKLHFSQQQYERFIKSFKMRPNLFGLRNGVKYALNTEFSDLNREFRSFLREKLKDIPLKKEGSDYGRDILARDYLYFSFSDNIIPDDIYDAAFSPDAKNIAAVIVKDGRLRIVILDLNGRIKKELTPGFSFYKFGISLKFDEMAHSLCWSGKYILFFALDAKLENVLFFIDVDTGKVTRKIKMMKEVKNPMALEVLELTDSSYKIIFSAQKGSQRDLFLLDNSGSGNIKNLTNDEDFEYDLRISPDKKKIVYTKVVKESPKLFILDLETGAIKSNDSRPYWGAKEEIYFISDRSEKNNQYPIKNVWKIDIKNGSIYQLTDLVSDAQFVLFYKENLYLGILGYRDWFHQMSYSIYETKLKDLKPLNAFTTAVESNVESNFSAKEKAIEVVIDKNRIKKYKTRIQLDSAYVVGFFSTYYGFFGLADFSFSDFVGHHQLGGYLVNFGKGSYRDIEIYYYNLARPLWWGADFKSRYYYLFPYTTFFIYNIDNKFFSNLVQDINSLSLFARYPVDLIHRFDFVLEMNKVRYFYPEPNDEEQKFLDKYFQEGSFGTFRVEFVRDAAFYKSFGPWVGDRLKVGLFYSTGGYNYGFSIDARKYLKLGENSLFATRGFYGLENGKSIMPFLVGDLGLLRGYGVLQFSGNRLFLGQLELRLPLIYQGYSSIALFQNVRLNFFMDIANIRWNNEEFNKMLNGEDGNWKASIGVDFEFGRFYLLFLDFGELHISISKKLFQKDQKEWITQFYFGYNY